MENDPSPSQKPTAPFLWKLVVGFWIVGMSAMIVGVTATTPLTTTLLTILFSAVSFGDAGYFFFRSEAVNRNALGVFFVILGAAGLAGVWLTWDLQAISLWGRMAMAVLWAIAGKLTFALLLTPEKPPER